LDVSDSKNGIGLLRENKRGGTSGAEAPVK